MYLGRGLDKRLTPLGRWLYRRTKGGMTRPVDKSARRARIKESSPGDAVADCAGADRRPPDPGRIGIDGQREARGTKAHQ